jgi:hypothetical protein
MSQSTKGHQLHEGSDSGGVHKGHLPYWKQAHRDWRVWVGVIVIMAAMVVYVMSQDLSLRPRTHPQTPVSGSLGK